MGTFLYSAGAKIVFLSLALWLWSQYVQPSADIITAIGQYYLNLMLYTVVPYEAMVLVRDAVILWSTLKISVWIFAPGAQDTNPKGSQGMNASSISGYSSSNLYD